MSEQARQSVELIDRCEVARMYSVSVSTVRQWEALGRIPRAHVRRKKFTRWLRSDIEADILSMKEAERRETAA